MKPVKSPGMDSRGGSDLRPSLTRTNAVAMVAGTIIGASIFVQPSEIARHLGTPHDIMLVWLACGVLTFRRARLRRARLGVPADRRRLRVPARDVLAARRLSVGLGDVLEHAHRHHRGDRDGVRALRGAFSPVGDGGVRVVAVAVILALSALNYVGVRAGSRVQTMLTIVKVVAIVRRRRGRPAVAAQTRDPPDRLGKPRRADGLQRLPARDGGRPVRVRRLAHGDLHRGRNHDAGAHDSASRSSPGSRSSRRAISRSTLVYLRCLPLDAVRASTRIAADAADVCSAAAAHR